MEIFDGGSGYDSHGKKQLSSNQLSNDREEVKSQDKEKTTRVDTLDIDQQSPGQPPRIEICDYNGIEELNEENKTSGFVQEGVDLVNVDDENQVLS